MCCMYIMSKINLNHLCFYINCVTELVPVEISSFITSVIHDAGHDMLKVNYNSLVAFRFELPKMKR